MLHVRRLDTRGPSIIGLYGARNTVPWWSGGSAGRGKNSVAAMIYHYGASDADILELNILNGGIVCAHYKNKQ
jgi:hypothetical protein